MMPGASLPSTTPQLQIVKALDGKETRTFLAGAIRPPKPPPTPPPTEPGDQRLMPVTISFAPYYTGMSIAPDGQSVMYGIAFPDEKHADLFVLNFDDSMPRRLNLDGFNDEPDWSPRGDRIAYVHSVDGIIGDLYLSSLDSRCQLRLTTGEYIRYPTWSPDGRKIAFIALGRIYILDIEKYLSDEYFNPGTCK
jgi:hypothetical protein